MSRAAWRAIIILICLWLALIAGCLVARSRTPPATIVPPSATASRIATTTAPPSVPATETPVPPTPTATNAPTFTPTFMPNPSTLVTPFPSPAALPGTGSGRDEVTWALLIGLGLILAAVGLSAFRSKGHPSS